MQTIKNLMVAEDGQSMVEYGLIVGVMAVGISAVLIAMKDQIGKIFTSVTNELKKVSAGGGK